VSRNNTLHRYIEIDGDELMLKISNVVVDTIIGELLFRPEDEMAVLEHDDGEALDPNIAEHVARLIKLKRNALLLFKPDCEADNGSYIVMIKNIKRFQLIIKHVSCGMSFRQIAAAIRHTRDVMSIGKLSDVSDHLVGQYVYVLVGVALTKISVLFSSDDVWAFSIAFDGTTHRGAAFFDVRICISVKGILYNFHLIAMPHFGRHTADLQVKMLVMLLGALCVSWADKLIGVATDGERTNMGHITGIQKQLVDLATHDMTQVNYVNHQVDLIVQATVELINGGNFVAKVYEVTVYLRKQNMLITEMGVASPKKTNRWAALNNVLQFDIKYERQIITFIDERREQRGVDVPLVLSETWWVQVFAVALGLELVHKMFYELQARLLLICQQRAYVNKLAVNLQMVYELRRIDMDAEFGDLDVLDYFHRFNWFITFESLELFFSNQGSRAEGHFDALDDFAQRDVLASIGMFAMSIVQGIINIQAERNSCNEPTDKEAPLVMPSDLVHVQPVMFFRDILQPHNVHLIKANWDKDAIYEIEQQHRDFVKAYKYEPPGKTILDQHDHKTKFNDAWEALGIRFATLRTFCGGLATLFPNSTSVESDFSVLKWEKDPYRNNLLDLSLEGVFQSKQFEALAII